MMQVTQQSSRGHIVSALLITCFCLVLSSCSAGSGKTQLQPVTDFTFQPAASAGKSPEIQLAESSEEQDEDDIFFEDDEDELFSDTEIVPKKLVADPLEPFNRAMFYFNDKVYFWVLKPVAKGYKKVTPKPVRKGLSNFFVNLKMPIRFVSSVLQGKIKGAGSELGRFVVNTTAGFLGFGDPATKYLHMKPSNEDLGQTLGKYGIGNGFYIVLPFLGPSTLRDTAGQVGHFYINPIYKNIEPMELSLAANSVEVINKTSFRIGDYEALKDAYLDPYERIKEFYIQTRNSKIEN